MKILIINKETPDVLNFVEFKGESYTEAIQNAKAAGEKPITENPVEMKDICVKAGRPNAPVYPSVKIEMAEGMFIYPEKTPDFDLYIGNYDQAYYILANYIQSLKGTFGKTRYIKKEPVPEEDALKFLLADVDLYGINTVMQWVYYVIETEQLKMR